MENKIIKPAPLLPATVIERAKKLGSALLADGMKGLNVPGDGCMDCGINPVDIRMRVVGTAFTLESSDGDNLPIHLSMKLLKEGYVLVVDGKNYTAKAYFGDLIARQAQAMGAEGIIIDGYVRDRLDLTEMGYPVFARGYMQRGPGKKDPGTINYPIVCGGVTVNPGDLVIGDCDGVTVVPREKVDAALEAAEKKLAYEENRVSTIAKYREAKAKGGELFNLSPAWVDEQLSELGVTL